MDAAKIDWDKFARLKSYYYVGRNYELHKIVNKDLRGINFTCSNFRSAKLVGCDLSGAKFTMCDFSLATFKDCIIEDADFSGADMTNASLSRHTFTRTTFWHTVFKGALLKNTTFFECQMQGADLCRAECLGTRFDGSNVAGMRNVDRAIFRWFMNPQLSGKPVYDPYPGAMVLTEGALGPHSFQENSGLGQTGLEYNRHE
jgi:uncharacterized protein YjbI with pentapeptide repeats